MRSLRTSVALCLLLIWIGITAAAEPCTCNELTVSGAGNTNANGAYTREPFITTQEWFEGTEMWIGPAYSFGSIHGNWAVLHFQDSTWFAGLFVVYSGGEHDFYVLDSYYMNASTKRCPPETGWKSYSGEQLRRSPRWVSVLRNRRRRRRRRGHRGRCASLPPDRTGGDSRTPEQRLGADVDEDGDVDHDDVHILAEQLLGVCP